MYNNKTHEKFIKTDTGNITMSVVVYNDESSINPLKANVLYRTVRANEYFYEERKKIGVQLTKEKEFDRKG